MLSSITTMNIEIPLKARIRLPGQRRSRRLQDVGLDVPRLCQEDRPPLPQRQLRRHRVRRLQALCTAAQDVSQQFFHQEQTSELKFRLCKLARDRLKNSNDETLQLRLLRHRL